MLKPSRLFPFTPRAMPINSLVPNILTTMALCSGLTSIRFSLLEKWHLAVTAIVIAAILDALDGRVARLLKGSTRFGAELDSLSDFVCFGVAPVLLLYLWTLQAIGSFGWLCVLAYAVCAAMRLARFNTALDEPNRPAWMGNFFTGVPSPAGAGLVLLPMMASFEWDLALFRSPILVGLWALITGFLMVSKLPTYSFKKVRVRRSWVPFLLLGLGLALALFMSEPWETLVGLLGLYILSMPLSLLAYMRHRQRGGVEPATAAAGASAAAPVFESRPPGETPPGQSLH